MDKLLFILAVLLCAALLALGVILLHRRQLRKTMESLDAMLEAAINGTFSETHFDESKLSALETRLAHYLSATELSAKNLATEKDAIKELIGDISHQTKTPLSNILLYSQLLKEQALPAEAKDYVQLLNTQAEKLRFLIDALVKTSRLETGVLTMHPEKCAISSLLEAALSQIIPSVEEKDLSLRALPFPADAHARFDLKWTTEALYNLLDNAVKYTPSGGSITIRITSYELFCKIAVIDTGIGIAEEEFSQIFSRFYRSPAVAQENGVGIGLYLARQIVTSQGGYLQVSSEIGKGSVFSLFLPV